MIQVVNRALSILEFIAQDNDRKWGLSEIADALGLNHGTCANILKTLVARGYIEQAGAKRGYCLGPMAYRLARADDRNRHLVERSRKEIDELCSRIDETVILSVVQHGARVLLYEARSDQEIQTRTPEKMTPYRATTGRLIISHYSPKELQDLVEMIGLPRKEDWPEVGSFEDLVQALNTIRNERMLITKNNRMVVGLATPIYKNNKLVASLGIHLPDFRFSKNEKTRIVQEMLRATERINRLINNDLD